MKRRSRRHYAEVAVRPETWADPMAAQGHRLENLHRITPTLYRSAQPRRADMAALQQLGIRTVVSLRSFNDDKKVFTNSYDGTKDRTFADVYVDAMARSSKTSKILRDKLLSERKNALNMAMVCLLVNLGRMNTTLNCEFPLLISRQ